MGGMVLAPLIILVTLPVLIALFSRRQSRGPLWRAGGSTTVKRASSGLRVMAVDTFKT